MMLRHSIMVAAIFATAVLAGCDRLPGKPKVSDIPLSPWQVASFDVLFGQNCAGCHGNNGRFGAAYELANPTFQALIDDAALTTIISNGMAGTVMPAFAQKSGGFLTEDQIRILVDGMRRRWRTIESPQGAPPIASSDNGDAARGAQMFDQSCAPCHGEQGEGGANAPGSIVDPSYLALVSDGVIRALIIAGRDDLKHPDWRGYPPGPPLSGQQVADLVAFLGSKRSNFVQGRYVTTNPMR